MCKRIFIYKKEIWTADGADIRFDEEEVRKSRGNRMRTRKLGKGCEKQMKILQVHR